MVDPKLLRSLVKGMLTYLPGVKSALDNKKLKSRHSSSHAEFCYTLWLSILRLFDENGIQTNFDEIGEIGTGGSLGVGICALLTGSRKFYALETAQTFDKNLNLEILDELIILFKNHTKIPDKYKQLNVKVKNRDFPKELISPIYLSDDTIAEIVSDIETGFQTSKRITIIKDWENQPSLNLDFIFSRAVMEHVSNPEKEYNGIAKHLSKGSYMFHDIELHSHGLTKRIDGHYKIPGYIWSIIYGRRPYFLNRLNLDDHLCFINGIGFKIEMIQETVLSKSATTKDFVSGATILAKNCTTFS